VRGHDILLVLSAAFAAAATSGEVFAEASPATSAIIVKTMTLDEVVAPDGSYTTTLHVERAATNQSAAQKIAQQRVEYSESLETAEIAEAFTRKTDGRVLEVDRSRIFAQAPPGSPVVPMFTDRKQKVVVFPNVAPGDTVVFTIRRTHKPFFPGQFFGGDVFQPEWAFEDVQERITLPKSMTAHIEVRDVEHHAEEDADNATHVFVYRNPLPPAAAAAALSPWDTDPQYYDFDLC